MTTYDAMNQKIIALLRVHDNPAILYAADRIEELEIENARLKDGLRKLVDKLDAVNADPQYGAAWTLYYSHGGHYKGPDYHEELVSAKELLK
jgi:hypothetical protein